MTRGAVIRRKLDKINLSKRTSSKLLPLQEIVMCLDVAGVADDDVVYRNGGEDHFASLCSYPLSTLLVYFCFPRRFKLIKYTLVLYNKTAMSMAQK